MTTQTNNTLNIKEYIFTTLENSKNTNDKKSKIKNIINRFLYTLILANVLSMILQTVNYFEQYSSYFSLFENISLIIFTLEYLSRIWTYKLHKKYLNFSSFVFSPMMIFDALVILPHIANIFFPNILDLRILRIIRVFRIFRLYKYSNTIDKILDITLRHKQVLLSAFSFIMMGVVTSATLMYFAEKDAQPEIFSSIPQAIYWAVITISTVGYGDFAPITDLGKLVAVCTTIFGVAIYALPTSILGAAFYAELMSKESYLIDSLKKENKHLQYLIHNSQREMKTLRDIIKKEREQERGLKKENKITKKFLNFFK
jgi:voltage-gated potassium channel